MFVEILAWATLAAAALPAILTLINLRVYRPLPPSDSSAVNLSVLIPARDEEANIAAALEAILMEKSPTLEIIVLDDHSTDRTAEIVTAITARDPRVRLEKSPPLPAGWCGKQHACHILAGRATRDLFVFIDADVRLLPGALPRLHDLMTADNAPDLASGFPRQIVVTFSEKLLLPLIHFILLGYLPMPLMRRDPRPELSAGCGQLMIAKRAAYEHSGGHAGIRASLHDGVKLPRLFRAAGHRTDLFDATDLATCRMYRTNAETWAGLAKNATEGLAAPATIGPMSVLLFTGHILPFLLLPFCGNFTEPTRGLLLLACALALLPRLIAARKFHQPLLGALLHPLGILCLLIIQWRAFVRHLRGQPAIWKARPYL
jgi:hypothetical protein